MLEIGLLSYVQSNSKAVLQPVVSAAWFNGKAVTGTVSGHLYVWNGPSIETIVRAHDETVNSLFVSGDVLISGGKDSKVNIWNAGFTRAQSLDTKGRIVRSVSSFSGVDTVRVLGCLLCACFLSFLRHASCSLLQLLVGLANADIITLDASGREALLHEGHSYGELWALAVHPSNKTFVTAGDDKCVACALRLRVWLGVKLLS